MTISIQIPSSHGGKRLDQALSKLLEGHSREVLKKAILRGEVTLEGTPVNSPSLKVEEGQIYEIEEPKKEPTPTLLEGEDIPLSIVFEDDHLIVIDKPAGLVVHPGAGNPTGTLVHALIHHCGMNNLSSLGDQGRPGIVHRLDKETSGLMVVAKTNRAHQGLAAQFEDRSLSRTYLAFVEGLLNPLHGTIEKPMGRSDKNRKKMAVMIHGGKAAVTHYETLKTFTAGKSIVASLVQCNLETGRTHQIRVHLTETGHCIIGDPLYGRHRRKPIIQRLEADYGPKHWDHSRQALHAASLRFIHPDTKEEMEFHSPLPEDLAELESILETE